MLLLVVSNIVMFVDADQSLSEFLVGLNSDLNWGFKRPERLDVKKPGPPFKTNNYAFKVFKNVTLLNCISIYLNYLAT